MMTDDEASWLAIFAIFSTCAAESELNEQSSSGEPHAAIKPPPWDVLLHLCILFG